MDGSERPTAALFAGQLSERIGMGRALLESDPELIRFVETIELRCGRPLLRPMFEGPAEELGKDETSQPAVFALGCATWMALLRSGRTLPSAIAGYSLGNYAALVAAGCLTTEEALDILLRVLQLVGELRIEGAMGAVVGMPEKAVSEACARIAAEGEWVEPANLNAENQIVVAGTAAGVDRFLGSVSASCLKAIRLPMRLPIHSRLMSPIAEVLRRHLPGTVRVQPPRIPLYSAVFGRRVVDADEVLEILVSQVERPSRWGATVQALVADGHTRFVELGSGEVLTRMLRWIDRRASGFPLETPADLARIARPLPPEVA
jgi:[acyl-carrier-protein] S-malonyltransferase